MGEIFVVPCKPGLGYVIEFMHMQTEEARLVRCWSSFEFQWTTCMAMKRIFFEFENQQNSLCR